MKKFKFITLSVTLLMVLTSFSSWAGLRDRSSLIELLPNRDKTTVVGNLINLPEVSTPTGNPATNWGWLYVKANGNTTGLYFEDDTGTVGTVALSSLATNLLGAANYVGLASNGILFEGATADAFETTITPTDPTADRTVTIPDASGEVTLLGQTISESELTTEAVDGLHSARIARATYDFAADGGAISTIGLGVTLPDNAIIIRAWYEVLTTCTSATDEATIAISIPTDDAGGIVTAIAISDVSNVWDVGSFEAIQTGTVANFSEKTTAARELSVDIAVEALTAGKFILYAEYVVSD